MKDPKTIDDRMLKDLLLMGEKAFQEGVYSIYVEEAKRRKLDLTFLEYMKPENKKKHDFTSMFSMKDMFS